MMREPLLYNFFMGKMTKATKKTSKDSLSEFLFESLDKNKFKKNLSKEINKMSNNEIESYLYYYDKQGNDKLKIVKENIEEEYKNDGENESTDANPNYLEDNFDNLYKKSEGNILIYSFRE